MEIIVLEYSEVYGYPELSDYVDDLYSDGEGDDFTDNSLRMFESDPDLIRLNGETSHFIDVDVNGVKYVIYTNEIGDIEDVLARFFAENWKEYFKREADEWSVYSALDNAIAYRGGKGYRYAIYSF